MAGQGSLAKVESHSPLPLQQWGGLPYDVRGVENAAGAHFKQQLSKSWSCPFHHSDRRYKRRAFPMHLRTRQQTRDAQLLPNNTSRCSSVNVTHAEASLETAADTKGDEAKKGFHQSRFAATKRQQHLQQDDLAVQIREPTSDQELNAVAMLRALSFYAYRPERAFAGKLHQKFKAKEEYERLLQLRENRSRPDQQVACLAAYCRWDTVSGAPDELRVRSEDGEDLALVGSLDICVTRSVEGEVLIGQSKHAAYLSNVCVSEVARRRSVGRWLLEEARRIAQRWGVDSLYVHTMAVNEVAQQFYAKHGFVIEQEETSNEAHYRGHCLDGIEGRGRTVLLRDEIFRKVGP